MYKTLLLSSVLLSYVNSEVNHLKAQRVLPLFLTWWMGAPTTLAGILKNLLAEQKNKTQKNHHNSIGNYVVMVVVAAGYSGGSGVEVGRGSVKSWSKFASKNIILLSLSDHFS